MMATQGEMGAGEGAATGSVTTWHPYSKLTLRTKALWYPGSPKTTNVSPSCAHRIACLSAPTLLLARGRVLQGWNFLGLGEGEGGSPPRPGQWRSQCQTVLMLGSSICGAAAHPGPSSRQRCPRRLSRSPRLPPQRQTTVPPRHRFQNCVDRLPPPRPEGQHAHTP